MSVMPRSSDLVFQNKSHYEPVFNNRYYEKLFIINDECDGIVWEKLHGNGLTINTAYWYPGHYASWQYTHCLIHGSSEEVGVVCEQGLPYDRIFRTANFLVATTGLWYYSPRNTIRFSKDGLNWYPPVTDVPGSWGQPAQGWSSDSDKGITIGTNKDGVNGAWRITLRDGKPPLIEKVADLIDGETYSGYYGNYVGRGHKKKDYYDEGEDPNIEYYMFMDVNGSTFMSALPYNYSYTDLEPEDPAKRIKRTTYNWRIEYYHGKYYATAKQNVIRYYNEIKKQWQIKKNMVIVTSDTCFSSINYEIIEDIKDTDYEDWVIGDGGIEYVKNDGKWIGTSKGPLVDYLVIPLVGNTGSDVHDCVIVNINSEDYKNKKQTTITESRYPYIEHNAYVRQIDFESMKQCVGVDNYGHPEDIGPSLMPTGFMPNGWSSESYDTCGFIYVGPLEQKYKDEHYHQNDRAWFSSTNYMIDKGNATWGEDDWYLYYNVKDYINEYDKIAINESYGYKRHSYKITGDPVGADHIKLHNRSQITCEMQNWDPEADFGRGAYITEKFRTRTLRRGQKTWMDFDASDTYDETSEYYVCAEEDPVISEVGDYRLSPDASKHEGFESKAYCFMVHWKYSYGIYSWYTHKTGPLVISADEFDAFYITGESRSSFNNIRIYRFFGQQWYVSGLDDGLSGDRTDCDKYVDFGYMDNYGQSLSDEARAEIVYQCLKRVFEPEE